MGRTSNGIDLWLWPLTAMQTSAQLAETLWGAQSVVAARLPVIAAAISQPASADRRELSGMVSEKVDAFGRSQRSTAAAGRRLRAAAEANARDLGRLSGGGMLWPADWLRMFDRTLAAAALMTTMPGTALAPIHRQVTANRKRLAQPGLPA